MLRVSSEVREEVLRIAKEEFGGVSADTALRRLLDEHWEARASEAVRRYSAEDREGWSRYLAEADATAAADAPVTDQWTETPG